MFPLWGASITQDGELLFALLSEGIITQLKQCIKKKNRVKDKVITTRVIKRIASKVLL